MGCADIHAHTNYSGFGNFFNVPYPESVTPPEVMVDIAAARKLDVLAVTDHNEIMGALKAAAYARKLQKDVEVVVGEEITTDDGEVLALYISELIPRDLSAAETVDRIHEQGGLAVVPHPYSYHCPSIGAKLHSLPFDGVEVLNAAHRDPYVNKLAQQDGIDGFAKTGGSDAHSKWMVGNARTEFDGTTAGELYAALKNRRTVPAGGPTPLIHCIYWSMEVAAGVGQRLVPRRKPAFSADDPLAEVTRMRKHNKMIAFAGCVTFLSTPLPLVCGLMGEGIVRWKGRRKWTEHTGRKSRLA